MSKSGRYHVPQPEWIDDDAIETEPPPPEAAAYKRISWAADDEREAAEMDYLIKAYKRMSTERRVILIEAVKSWDSFP